MTPTITLPRAVVEQALEAMRRAVPTGKITLYEWDRAISDLSAALAMQRLTDAQQEMERSIESLKAALAQQAEPDHETRAELAEQQVVQLAEERDHYRNLWQKAQQAEPVEPVSNEALRLAGLELIGLAEHDQHCDVFDLDDQGRHKACTCGLNDAIAVITQAGKSSPPQRKPLTIERLRDALVASRIIPPAAVEDPEEYDDGVTLHRIEALHRRIT